MGRNATDTALYQDVCAGAIQGDGTVRRQTGCVVARTGVGVYTITINPVAVNGEVVTQQGNLTGGVPQDECASEVTPVAGAARCVTIDHTSDTVKTVTITDDADVDTDTDFEFAIRRLLG